MSALTAAFDPWSTPRHLAELARTDSAHFADAGAVVRAVAEFAIHTENAVLATVLVEADKVAAAEERRLTARRQALQQELERQRDEAEKVPCPTCHELPGERCRTLGRARQRKNDFHVDRLRLSRGTLDVGTGDAESDR